MAQNFQGLGFSFSAKDAGLQRYLKTTSSLSGEMSQSFDKFGAEAGKTSQKQGLLARGFNFIGDSVHSLWGMMKKAGSTLFGWVASAPKKIMQVADAMSDLGRQTGGNQGLTTSFEAMAQEASVSSRKVLAQAGMMGKALDNATGKASGLVLGMKTSAQTAGQAVASMSQFGKELKALGIDSAETAVKLEDGLGVSSRDLAFNFHKVQVGLKLTDKDLSELGKSFTATGETIHDMVKPLQNMPQLLELAQKRSNLVAQGMSSIGGKDSIKSMNRAIQSLFVLTGDAKGAQESAVALESKMIDSMENFRNMFAGTSTDLDAFLTNTSVVTGDVRKAFQAAAQGPDAFIKEFSGVIAKLKHDGKKTEDILKFFGGQMSQALGPDLANTMITALANADDAKMKTLRGLKDVGKSIGDVAKESWRSSMTLSESLDRVMGAAMMQFRGISRAEAVTFVQDSQKAFATFNAGAAKLVKEGGPLAEIVKKMSLLTQLGPMALVPESLRPSVQVFSELYKNIMPGVEAYQKFSNSVLGSLGPLGLLGGALMFIHGAYKDTEKSAKKAGKTVGKVWGEWIHGGVQTIKGYLQGAGSFIGDLGDELADVFKNIDWGEIWGTLSGIWGTLISAITGAWKNYVEPFAKGFWAMITGGITSKNADKVKGPARIGAAVGEALMKAAAFVKDGVTQLWSYVIDWWHDNGDKIKYEAYQAFDKVKTAIHNWWVSPETQKTISDIEDGIKDAFKSAAKSVYDTVANWLKGKLHEAWDEIKTYAVTKIADMVGPIADSVYKLLAPFRAVRDAGTDAFQSIKDKVDKIFGHSVNTVVGADMDKTVKVVEDAATSIIKGMEQGMFDAIVNGLTNAFKEGFKISMNVSKKFFVDETKAFTDFLENIILMFRRSWMTILNETDEAVQASKASVQSAFEDLRKLQTAMQELQSMRVALAENAKGQTLTAEQRKQQIRAMTASEMQETLVEQTMNPDWYKDYRDRFDGGIGQIVQALRDIKGIPVGGGSSAAGTLAKKFGRAPQPVISAQAGVDQFGMSGNRGGT